MGLINNNKKPIKKEMKKPLKKPMMKKIEKPIVNETIEQKTEEIVEQQEQVIEEEVVKESVNDEITETTEEEQEIDVNANKKNDVCVAEDFEVEKNSENELEDEDVSEQLEPEDQTEEKTKKKTKKKQSKKDKQKDQCEDENIGNCITDYNEAHDYLSETINFTSEEWEAEKEELANQVRALYISPDLNPDSIKKLLSDMSIAYTTVKERLCDVENYYNGLEKKIKDIKVLNSVGANASERNINAQRAVNFYKNNPNDDVYIDLELYAITIQDKMNFYKSLIDTMNYNRQLLITFASAFKIEINNY